MIIDFILKCVIFYRGPIVKREKDGIVYSRLNVIAGQMISGSVTLHLSDCTGLQKPGPIEQIVKVFVLTLLTKNENILYDTVDIR